MAGERSGDAGILALQGELKDNCNRNGAVDTELATVQSNRRCFAATRGEAVHALKLIKRF
jgi:hypothetical protein